MSEIVDRAQAEITSEMRIIEKLLPSKDERTELELAMAKKYITRAALVHNATTDDIDAVSKDMLDAMAALTRAQQKLRQRAQQKLRQREPGEEG